MAGRASLAKRREQGKSARKRVARSRMGPWDPAARTEDAIQVIQAQNHGRARDLVPIRHTRMAASPWTFYRGAAAVMATDLAATPNTGLGVQLCGDAHVLNFGLWATPERNLWFDLRDFDETLRGPFEWDLKRLVTSLVIVARENGLPDATADAAVKAATAGYRRRMARYVTAPELRTWYSRVAVDDLLGFFESEDRGRLSAHIERQASRRTSHGAYKKLTTVVDGQRRIREEPPFRVRTDDFDQVDLVREVVESYRASLQDHVWHLLNRFTVVDTVRQVVGVGSVGMRVFLVLLEGRYGEDPLFLQVKQATTSVYERHLEPSPASSHGARVINGKRLLQTATDIFAGWTSVQGMDFYVRQFRDMKIIPDGQRIAPRLAEFSGACGEVLARAHARSGDAAAICAYIGRGDGFDEALRGFARTYADQNARDHAELTAGINDGSIVSAPDR